LLDHCRCRPPLCRRQTKCRRVSKVTHFTGSFFWIEFPRSSLLAWHGFARLSHRMTRHPPMCREPHARAAGPSPAARECLHLTTEGVRSCQRRHHRKMQGTPTVLCRGTIASLVGPRGHFAGHRARRANRENTRMTMSRGSILRECPTILVARLWRINRNWEGARSRPSAPNKSRHIRRAMVLLSCSRTCAKRGCSPTILEKASTVTSP
jgi:hypothetical protein